MSTSNKTPAPKPVRHVLSNNQGHWVGDGFPVRTLFHYGDWGRELTPFLMLDYAGPAQFPPTTRRLGVGEHPHRGFETVTIVYDGEVEHRDSSGGGGLIGAGDVQWMTAGAGLVHEEFHGHNFAQRGGRFEMVQLWVNLPAEHKMTQPRYQSIQDAQIPAIPLTNQAGQLRVIAGNFEGTAGPALTFTPMNVWDIRLLSQRSCELSLPDGHPAALVVLNGQVTVNGSERVLSDAQVAVLDRSGTTVQIESMSETRLLLLCGEPIDEPIFGRGPFVMNTAEEIRQAMLDYQSGKMGHLSG